jgi:hypothetical protein
MADEEEKKDNKQQDEEQEEFMSMDEVMGELDVEKDDLEQMVSQGKLRAYRSDNEMKFREEDVSSIEDSGQVEALSESDQYQTISEDTPDEDQDEMTDIGDTTDHEVDMAEEEEELDLDDIDVEDDELEELAEDLMLDEEESAEEDEEDQEDADEEIIFEEENVSASADETGEEAIELDPDELDDQPSGSGTEQDTASADDTGKTMQMDSGVTDKSLDDDEPSSTQKQKRKETSSTSRTRRTTRRSSTQTARRQRRAGAGTQTQLSKLWVAVIIIGVIISLEGLLIGVDMARISTASDQKQIEPWATSAPAEFMLNLSSDRKMTGNASQSSTSAGSSSSTSGE